MKWFLVSAVLAASPSLLSAQDRSFDAAVRYWVQASQICIDARQNEALSTDEKVQVCNAVGAMMDSKASDAEYAPRNDAEANVFWFNRSTIYAMLQGIHGDADGRRSRRVCDMVRMQKAALDKIKDSAWPEQRYRELGENSRQSVKSPYDRCTAEFGY